MVEKLEKPEKLDGRTLRARLLAAREQRVETLDFEHLPAVSAPAPAVPASPGDSASVPAGESVSAAALGSGAPSSAGEAEALARVLADPGVAAFGGVVRSSGLVRLTEAETEYAVWVRKHVFARQVVLQFSVGNTVEGQALTDVAVRLALAQGDAADWTPLFARAAPCVAWGQTADCLVALGFDPARGVPEAAFDATLQFQAKDVEPDELDQLDAIEGFAEEYPLEQVLLAFPDFVARPAIPDFRAAWADDALQEAVEKVSLPFEDVETAVGNIVDVLGLAPLEGTQRVPAGVGLRRCLECRPPTTRCSSRDACWARRWCWRGAR